MINNFICDSCNHYMVCEKLKPLMKFHESANKNLMITLTMDECVDYDPDSETENDIAAARESDD